MIGPTTLSKSSSARKFFQAVLLGGLACALGLSLLLAGTPAWAQEDSPAELATNSASSPAANVWTQQAETVEKALSEKLSKSISMQVENVMLEEALRQIAEKGDVELVYGSHSVLSDRTLTLRLEDVSVQTALSRAVEDTGLEPMLSSSGYIVLIKQSNVTDPQVGQEGGGDFSMEAQNLERAPLSLQSSRVQQGTIRGTVTDQQTGEPLPGVNVVIEGTQQGASTGGDGQYTISGVEAGSYTMQASFVGYATQTKEEIEVQDNETTVVDFRLQPEEVALEDVVVTALGVEREERSLTYSTEEVNTEQISEARELNVVNSLTGRVAGLDINQGGFGVGSPSKVLLRGNRSFNTSDDPLYVVDGVPVRGGIRDLNPDIIEGINVLKGPNAAALYGSAAQNGAIVVTTSRGEEGGLNVSFNQNIQVKQPKILPSFQNKYGQGKNGEYSRRTFNSWGPEMNGQMVRHWSANPELSSTEVPYSPQPGNVRDFFKYGYESASSITASGGTESIQGIFGYTYSNGSGVVPNNSLDRHNVSLRLNSQPLEDLSIDSKLSYTDERIRYQLGHGNHDATFYAYRIPRSIPTEQASNYEYRDEEGNLRHNTWLPGFGRSYNPYWAANNIRDHEDSSRLTGLASITYDFTDALSLMLRGSYDRHTGDSEDIIFNDTGTTFEAGYYGVTESQSHELNTDFLFTYDDNYGSFDLEANVGGNIKQRRNSSLNSNTGDGLVLPNFFAVSNSQNSETNYNPGAPTDIWSLYSSADIGWNDAVFLNVTGRNDWSSTLPLDNNSYFYPSVGLTGVLSDLVSLPETISFARVRASWTKVGNSAPPFRTKRFVNFIAGGNNGFLRLSTTLPADDLKPEETISYEFGLDIRFFDDRIGVDITSYQTNTRNQLFSINLPSASGASQLFTNGGDVRNRGLEVILRTTPVQSSSLTWNADINFAANRNTVVSISEERDILTIGGPSSSYRQFAIEEGEPFGQIYSRGFKRDDQGRVLIGQDGLPVITSGRTVQVANPTPDWSGGITTSLSYNNFSASMVIDHQQGGTLVSETATLTYGEGHAKGTLKGREGGLVFGENFFEEETAVMASDGSPNNVEIDSESFWNHVGGHINAVGEPFVEDATNARLRELTVGYQLPQSMLSGVPVSNVNLSLVGRNLFFIYRASDSVDPDILSGTSKGAPGLSSFPPPTSRTFGFNMSLDF